MNPTIPCVGHRATVHFAAITTTDIVKYSCASGDFNPLHFDHLYATARGMKGVVAHGMLSMGLCASGVEKAFGQSIWVKKIDARFISPVYAGMSVDIDYEITDAPLEGERLVSVRARVGDENVITGTATLALLPV